jgi:hypothetical protein
MRIQSSTALGNLSNPYTKRMNAISSSGFQFKKGVVEGIESFSQMINEREGLDSNEDLRINDPRAFNNILSN